VASCALEAAKDAQALVLCTPWPEYKQIGLEKICSVLSRPLVVDPSGFFRPEAESCPNIEYISIGYRK
jgi:hypothetical protein